MPRSKKRKTSSRSRSNRSSQLECIHCNEYFLNIHKLSEHCESSPNPNCIKQLVRCEYCQEYLIDNDSYISKHLHFNRRCRQMQTQDDDLRSVKNNDFKYESPKYDRQLNAHTYTGSFANLPVEMRVASNTSRSDTCNEIRAEIHDINLPVLKPFEHAQFNSDEKYKIDVQHSMSALNPHNNINMCNHQEKIDLFYLALLTKSPILDSNKCIHGTHRDFSVQIHNISNWLATEFEMDTLPSFSKYYLFSDISEHDILSFLRRNGRAEDLDIHSTESESDNEFVAEDGDMSEEEDGSDDSDDSEDDYTYSEVDEETYFNSLDNSINDYCNKIRNARNGIHFTESQYAMLDLHKILKEAGAKMKLFDELTQWCQSYSGAFDNQTVPSRKKFFSDIGKMLYGKKLYKKMLPVKKRVRLDDDSTSNVTTFSFKAQMASLLSDPILMKKENLLLDFDSNTNIPNTDPEKLGDINTGKWLKDTTREICIRIYEFVLPLIFFIDASNATKRLSVEPVIFTLGIFKRFIRNLAIAWRTLGCIEILKNRKKGTTQRPTKKSSSKIYDYHTILSSILEEYASIEGPNGGFVFDLEIDGVKKRVVFKLAIQIVLGDTQGLDKLCGQFGSHSDKMKKVCRDCYVPPSEADDPDHRCIFVKREDIIGKDSKQLSEISMHYIKNAFDSFYFGAGGLSIYEACPPDPLHGILLGIIKYTVEYFIVSIPPSALTMINETILHLYTTFSKQTNSDLPSLAPFRNGIDTCNILSAKEQLARLFAIYLTLMDPSILMTIATARKWKRNPKTESGFPLIEVEAIGKDQAKAWLLLVEDLLVMYHFIMKREIDAELLNPKTVGGDCSLQTRLRKLMKDMVMLVSSRGKCGLKIPKFHQTLHYTKYILLHGVPANWDTGRPESNAVEMYKKLVILTQRREQTIVQQLGARQVEELFYSEAYRLAYPEINRSSDDFEDSSVSTDDEIDGLFRGSNYTIRFEIERDERGSPTSFSKDLFWNSKEASGQFDKDLVSDIFQRLFLNLGEGGCLSEDSDVVGYTEFIDKHGNLYRAHPNYRKNGEWNDWCMIRWEGFDNLVPAKILTFLDLSNVEKMNEGERQEISAILNHSSNVNPIDDDYLLQTDKWVLVQSGLDASEMVPVPNDKLRNFRMESKIAKRFYLEDNYCLLQVTTIVRPCYCFATSLNSLSGKQEYIVIDDLRDWADNFVE